MPMAKGRSFRHLMCLSQVYLYVFPPGLHSVYLGVTEDVEN